MNMPTQTDDDIKSGAKVQLGIEVIGVAFLAALFFAFIYLMDYLLNSYDTIIALYHAYKHKIIACLLAILFIGLALRKRYKVILKERSSLTRSSSAWIANGSGIKPSFNSWQVLNVEIRGKSGKPRILWRVKASDIDFSLESNEPVISYMKVRSS
jgi:hypothetical protein